MSPQFPRIALVGRPADPPVAEALVALAQHACARGIRVRVDEACDLPFEPAVERCPESELAAHADLLVSVGGDGTLLYTARLLGNADVPLLGINRGRLGFLADISAAEMIERFGDVLEGRYTRDVRRTLRARLCTADGEERVALALNDVVLQKRETGRMLDFESFIDGHFVNAHGGDGLVVSTATGSTAYALSCGGPILTPDIDAIVIAPISPHTLSDRPLVVGGHSVIELRLVAQAPVRAEVTCDGVLLGDLPVDGRLVVEPSSQRVTLLHPPGYDYFRILRSKLHWGRGGRQGRPDLPC
jgi:NAD+ kinase